MGFLYGVFIVMANKIAIIGLGIMGRRMLENALAHPDFEVSGIWDPENASIVKAQLQGQAS
ncbi:hypothetical protein AB833_08375 [Chromatiales bacterium (ex Bugula neritina AB1)]|nr:hypothetical protein AB833_08375 [Chromatiales bacterium (ex Bugula neritina AB1)]